MDFSTWLSGFIVGFSLIMAIGAQNAFVLKQGLLRQHVVWLCLICATSDAILISLGVAGFTNLIAHYPWIEPAARYGGALFLFVYAFTSFRAAVHATSSMQAQTGDSPSVWRSIAMCLAFTWLNPHVYLDTVVLLGTLSTQYPGQESTFGLGAVMASYCFFFSLGYGAKFLAPLFEKPGAWRALDVLIGCLMTGIALSLIWPR